MNRFQVSSCGISALLVLVFWASASLAEETSPPGSQVKTLPQEYSLELPGEAETLDAKLKEGCPHCSEQGFLLCGDGKISRRPGFEKHFFIGEPGRGILLSVDVDSKTFRSLARHHALSDEHSSLLSAYRKIFERSSVIAYSRTYDDVELFPRPDEIEVEFPEKLMGCIAAESKPWGCCVSKDCLHECCEKNLGSPRVTATWTKMWKPGGLVEANDSYQLTFHPDLGGTRIERTNLSTGSDSLYWCVPTTRIRITYLQNTR